MNDSEFLRLASSLRENGGPLLSNNDAPIPSDNVGPIPSDVDRQMCKAAKTYLSASHEQRTAIEAQFPVASSVGLVVFAIRMATYAVRCQQSVWVKYGIAALAIENVKWDYRESLIALSLLYHSARRVGDDPDRLLGEIKDVVLSPFDRYYAGFMQSKTCIESMGYREKETPEGFSYQPLHVVTQEELDVLQKWLKGE